MNLVRRALRCGARQSMSPPPPPTRSRSWSRSRSPPPPPTSPAWSSWSPPPQLDHGHLLQLLYALPACVWKWKGWGDLYFYFSESFLVLTLPRISQSRQSCLLFQQGLLTQLASVQRHCTQRRVRCTKSAWCIQFSNIVCWQDLPLYIAMVLYTSCSRRCCTRRVVHKV